MSDLNVSATSLIVKDGKYYEVTNGKEKEVSYSVFMSKLPKSAGSEAPIMGLTVERSDDGTERKATGLDAATIDEGENMRTKKEYKELRKEKQAELQEEFSDYGNYKKKYAKSQAKQYSEIQKAADRVISSHYYTDKAAYKEAQKADPNGRHVYLDEKDQELLKDQSWDAAFEGRERDKEGNLVNEGTLNESKLKQVAAERIGYDNELEMEERKSETAAHADEVDLKNGKVTHKKARQLKNLYKDLGFDYQKDLTEVKRAAYVVTTTLAAAVAGKESAKTGLGQASGTGMSEGGSATVDVPTTSNVYNNGVLTSSITSTQQATVSFGSQVVKVVTKLSGAKAGAVGALIGLGVGLATMGKVVNDLEYKKNDILQGMDELEFVQKGDVKGIKKESNQIVMDKTIKMAKEKGLTDAQIACAIRGARGENNCLSEKELLKLYDAVKEYEPALAEEPTPTSSTEPVGEPTSAPSAEPAQEPTEECYNTEKKDVYSQMKVPQYRTGDYYISHGYVYEDGSNLSPADRKALQKELAKEENRIGEVRENGRRSGIQLKKEITLPNGEVVKVADDAYDRIMKPDAHDGGNDRTYAAEKKETLWRAVNCKTKEDISGWMTEEKFNKWELKRANKNK